jgi:plasmid maintenance system antidote protein VapI
LYAPFHRYTVPLPRWGRLDGPANASLSADMAIRFEKAFGVKADTLLRMQTAYELAQARRGEGEIRVKRYARAA